MTEATNWMIAVALAALASACGDSATPGDAGPDAGGDASTDSDTDNDTDTDTDTDTDADADTDTDTDTDTDADADAGAYTYEDAGSPYQLGVGGFLFVDVRNREELLGFTALAQFFDVSWPYELHQSKELLVAAAGIDTCELTYYDGGSPWAEGTLEWLTAGTVTLSSTPDAVALEEIESGLVFNYWADLFELGIEPHYGEEYTLTVSGDEQPAFDVSPAFVMPAALELVEPELDAVLPRTALAVTWTGGAPSGEAAIEMQAVDPESALPQKYEITCEVHDDGAFEVPEELMAALPEGWLVELKVSHSRRAVHPMPGDLDFLAVAKTFSTGVHTLGE